MFRLIGILAGSAVAAAFLITVLGVPALRSAGPEAALAPSAALETDAVPIPVVNLPPETAADVNADSEPVSAVPALPVGPQPEIVPEPAVVVEASTMPVEPATTAPATSEPPAAEQNWYAFWSPFRSQVAADGFVSELQRTTGLDYRVVKLKPGVYEVAFAYTDDADVETKLAQISTAAGLDLSGG
ncbi:MAG: hypothetical protein KJO46_04920 [Gammaproteobacteria bacterium]|nr:hypothetical protein [Gammaproteobacteria bacterium]